MISEINSKKVYDMIVDELNPRKLRSFSEVLNMFMEGRYTHFLGGNGDKRRTLHENIFFMLYPNLEPQVSFGTGKKGHKKYHSKRFIADFYDRKEGIVYEIDGNSHQSQIRKLKDEIRRCFFLIEHKIKTVRLSNRDVEKRLMKSLESAEKSGILLKWASFLMDRMDNPNLEAREYLVD